jgi:hypothetical protein
MPITERIDQYGFAAWIALIVLGFIVFWPIGLALLVFTFWSGRMGCGYHGGEHRWHHKMERMQQKLDRMRERMGGHFRHDETRQETRTETRSSGNHAFDEYRAQTLKRLEDEQREFQDFLERLRYAKDKTEFDAFMAERRNRPEGDAPDAEPSPA